MLNRIRSFNTRYTLKSFENKSIMFERNGTLLNRKFREYLIPTVLVTIALSLEMVINSAVVGNLLGEKPLSAIGLSTPVIYCMNAIFLLFAIGGVASAAIAKGRRNMEDADRFFTLTFAAGIVGMFMLLFACLVFMNPLSHFLAQGDDELARLTREYLTPMIFVGPLLMLVMGVAQFVRTDGLPRFSAWIALVANAVSLSTCYLLIRFCGMGIAGASVSTLLGYTVGVFMVLPYFLSKKRTFRFVKLTKNDRAKLSQIASIGTPDALTELLSFLRVLVLNALIVSAFGATGMAAMSVCLIALVLTYIFLGGTTDTLLPIVGTLFGERDHKGLRFTVRTGFMFTIAACAVMMAVLLVFPAAFGRLFGVSSPEGTALVVPALRMYALSLILFSVNTLLQSFYQTTGREKLATLIVVLNGFVFVVLFAFILAQWNTYYIWLAFLLSEFATLLVVLGVGLRIRKKEGVTGILLLPKNDGNGISADFSIPATVDAATGLSEQVMRFARENGTDESSAMRISIAVEEMAVNTARYGHKDIKGVMDVLLRITEQELILRLRDDGVPFDPTEYQPSEKETFAVGGIETVRRLAKEINYSRQLGFNVTIITIPRKHLKN